MSKYLSAEQRYMHDPSFRALVDLMVEMISNMDFTPSEMRDAAMFACFQHDMKSTRLIGANYD